MAIPFPSLSCRYMSSYRKADELQGGHFKITLQNRLFEELYYHLFGPLLHCQSPAWLAIKDLLLTASRVT